MATGLNCYKAYSPEFDNGNVCLSKAENVSVGTFVFENMSVASKNLL